MIKKKLLINGIGNYEETNNYYDRWSSKYDQTLLKWNYRAPQKSLKVLKKFIKFKPKKILDLACGTGLFAEELIKIYPKSSIDGIDISKKILIQAKLKNIYNNLFHLNFDKNFLIKQKYDLISCIGALTYTQNHKKLFTNIFKVTSLNGYFIFTHRNDLWNNQNYSNFLIDISHKWQIIFVSKPALYLPKNSDFADKIKIRITLLRKK